MMIELTRTITFGQYVNNGSALARMDPRAKLLCMVAMIALLSFVGNFAALAICLLFCLLLQRLSHISLLYTLRGIRFFVVFLLILMVIQILFYVSPTQPKTLLWHWGILSISWAGIINSAHITLRVLLLYYLVSMLMFTTSLVDMTDGADALLSPLQRIGIPTSAFVMVLVIAFKFVPILLGETERLMKAQAARGINFRKGSLLRRASQLSKLFIPLFVSAFKRADALSIAMEARCYGGRPGWRRSKRRTFHLTRFDMLFISISAITVVSTLTAYYLSPL